MKKFTLIVCTLACVCMTSCLEWTSQYTPQVNVTAFITASGDTLLGHYNEDTKHYTLDTICKGDTAFFLVYNQSFANNLVSSSITWDTTRLKMWTQVSDSFKLALRPSSDIEALRFDYQDGYNQTVIPVNMVPLKEGNTTIKFYVSSDSEYKESEGVIEVIVSDETK